MQGKFIVFEGIDGSGKSTQLQILAERLKNEGYKIYSTSEPTDSPIGAIIRNIFKGRIEADHKTITALFLADRLDHLQNATNGIIDKLKNGYIVICDRYYLSSYAYHGVHMPIDWVIQLNSVCSDLLRPDLNIYIDIDPETSMKRLNIGRDNIELYESLSNLEMVRIKYLESIEMLGNIEHILTVNGNDTMDSISNRIWEQVEPLLTVKNELADN